MAQVINWVEPQNSSVGSVLIYRSDNTLLDSLGSRTLVSTIDAKSGGNWVTQYSDAGGTVDSVYRIQFWDGVGSSVLSAPISAYISNLLCSFEDVIRVGRLRHIDGLGSAEVYDAIQDATDEVFYHYGDPVKKTAFYVDSETGVRGRAYDFTGDLSPVYQVREVYVDSVNTEIVPNTSFEVDYPNGNMLFTEDFLGSYSGRYVYVHWVPSIFNVLVKNMAALNLVEGELVAAGVDATNPQVERIKSKITDIKEYLRPKGAFSARQYAELPAGYQVIPQKTDRRSIFFNH